MSSRPLRAVAHAALLIAANLMLGLGTAHAGSIFRGTFDPIDFGGFIVLDVPANCIATDGFVAAGTGSCGDVVITSLFVQNPPPPDAATDSLTFAPPNISDEIDGLWWVNGVLTGIDSFDIGPAGPSDGPFFTNLNGYQVSFASGHFNNIATGSPQAFLLACNFGCDGGQQVGDPAVVHPFVAVSVPEPGSIALILGGLAAVWLTRRRRIVTR
jgi:hypothetical protein